MSQFALVFCCPACYFQHARRAVHACIVCSPYVSGAQHARASCVPSEQPGRPQPTVCACPALGARIPTTCMHGSSRLPGGCAVLSSCRPRRPHVPHVCPTCSLRKPDVQSAGALCSVHTCLKCNLHEHAVLSALPGVQITHSSHTVCTYQTCSPRAICMCPALGMLVHRASTVSSPHDHGTQSALAGARSVHAHYVHARHQSGAHRVCCPWIVPATLTARAVHVCPMCSPREPDVQSARALCSFRTFGTCCPHVHAVQSACARGVVHAHVEHGLHVPGAQLARAHYVHAQ